MDMHEMLQRAREMQQKAAELQRTMAAVEVEGQSGGGMVRITVTGDGVVKRVSLDPSLLKPEDHEMVEDLIVAAHADAKRRVEQRLAQEMSHLAGHLGLPSGLG